jgi:hypothetical protein
MRKKAGFNIEDRISVWYQADGEPDHVFKAWGEYIAAETLASRLQPGPGPQGAYIEALEIEGKPVIVAVKQA